MSVAENTDWFQFVSGPPSGRSASASAPDGFEKPVAGKAELPLAAAPPPSMPTPPASSHGSPTEESQEQPTIVSVSTTFYPGANLVPPPPDLVLLSSDMVFFYVHSCQLLSASTTRFKGLIPSSLHTPSPEDSAGKGKEKAVDSDPDADIGPVVSIPEPSSVLNVVLHTVYGMSCAHYSPSASTLLAATDALATYGVPPAKHAAPGTPLFELLLAHAPAAPLEFYALAGAHGLHALAVPVSAHLLGFPLVEISDEAAEKMGAIYLKRMVFLHLGRVDALKRLLLPPPPQHSATLECDYIEQKKVTRAWALASAYLAWDARADLSPIAIESALYSLNDHLSCENCKTALRDRIKQLIVQWAVVKRTV